MTPDAPAPPRVPKALFEGLLATRMAAWTPEAIRSWWAWCLTRTDPASVATVAGTPVLFLTTPALAAFVATSQRLDAVVFGLKDQAHKRRRWEAYCRDALTPQLLLQSVEACCAAGALTREEASRLQEAYLVHVNAQGHWKPWVTQAH